MNQRNQINQKNQTNQIDETDQKAACGNGQSDASEV